MEPIPVGAIVDYRGSLRHGRYVVTAHEDPKTLFPVSQHYLIADSYPDGVAYQIWPEGMPQKFGNREHMAYRVRRKSLTLVRLP